MNRTARRAVLEMVKDMSIILWIVGVFYGVLSLFFGTFLASAFLGQRYFNRPLKGQPAYETPAAAKEEHKLAA